MPGSSFSDYLSLSQVIQYSQYFKSMEQNKKTPFADIIDKKAVEAKLQKLAYVKVKVIFHHNDKTIQNITYRCSANQILMRLATSLRTQVMLKQHESVFIFSKKRLIDQKQRICDLKSNEENGVVVLQAATSDIF